MTLISAPCETNSSDRRTAMTPANAGRLVKLGAEVRVGAGLGVACGYDDEQYRLAGAQLAENNRELFAEADLVLRVRRPALDEIAVMQPGTIHISYLDPFNEKALIDEFCRRRITAISMEMIPRTTRAQKMDALSSQASLAGYVMVMLAANRLNRVLPMMMTPSGTIRPAKVFVIGAGVAGLQAIATARRLGARVSAFDTRAVVAEQVESLGASFLEIDLGETGQTEDGYARQLSEEQLAKQQQGQADEIARSDIVITTAQVFGRTPPRLVTREMVSRMQPGSVIVDMAAETGGNVEGSVAGETVEIGSVALIGSGHWPDRVCRDASDMYSNNLFNLVEEFWDTETNSFGIDLADDILAGCVLTHGGEIVNKIVRRHYAL